MHNFICSLSSTLILIKLRFVIYGYIFKYIFLLLPARVCWLLIRFGNDWYSEVSTPLSGEHLNK